MRGLVRMLLSSLLAGVALGQDDVDILVAQLHDAKYRIAALERLGHLGAKALPALTRDLQQRIQHNDQAGETRVLLAIGRMGAQAAPATDALTERLATAPDALLVPLLRALGCIGPLAVRTRPDLLEIVRNTGTPTGRVRQEWNLTLQRLALTEPTYEQLLALFRQKALLPVCVAALVLAEDPTRIDGLHDALVEAHQRALQLRGVGGTYQMMVDETALALVRTTTDEVQRDLAWGCLLGYHDPVVRLEAAVALRRDPGATTNAVPALVAALQDPERAVIRETMITLGFFSDEAIAALPPLQQLQQSGDAEMRQVATATMQSIRRSLSSIPAAVAGVLDVPPGDAAASVQRVATLGPRAKSPLHAMLTTATGELRDRCTAVLAELDR